MKVKNIHSDRTFSRIFNIIKWLPVLFIMVLVLIFINKKPVETDTIVEVSTSEDTEISTLVETEDSTELEEAESNTEEFESITESGSEESYAEETEYSTEIALAEKIGFVKCGTQNWFAENTGWIDFYLYEFVLD